MAIGQSERLVALEVQMQNVEKAVTDLKNDTQKGLVDLSAKIDNLANMGNLLQLNRLKIEDLEKEIDALKARKASLATMVPLIASIASSVITFLLIEFLKNPK